jgi:hypothetical protein
MVVILVQTFLWEELTFLKFFHSLQTRFQFGIRLSANEGDEGFQRLQFVSVL